MLKPSNYELIEPMLREAKTASQKQKLVKIFEDQVDRSFFALSFQLCGQVLAVTGNIINFGRGDIKQGIFITLSSILLAGMIRTGRRAYHFNNILSQVRNNLYEEEEEIKKD